MTPRIALRLDLWLPPILLMAVIFFLSAQPDLNSGLGTVDLIGRKFVHAGLYAALFLLWWRALRTVTTARGAIGYALAISIGYACTDEFHQHFVRDRHGSPIDVLIDTTGAAIAAFVVARRSR